METNEPNQPTEPDFDEVGPPIPNPENESALPILGGAIIWAIAIAGGIFVLPVLSSRSGTRGATRSAHVKWETRQAEIQKTIRTEQAASSSRDQNVPQ